MSFLFETKDFEQYSQYRGECVLDISQLFRDMIAESEEVRRTARESVYQWPEEMLRDFGQIEAIPEVIECLLDLGFELAVKQPAQLLSLAAELIMRLPSLLECPQYYGSSPIEIARAAWGKFNQYADRFRKGIRSLDSSVRNAAIKCLQALRQADDSVLIRQQLEADAESSVVNACLEALSCFPCPVDKDLLWRLASSQETETRCRALQLLAACDGSYPNEATEALASVVLASNKKTSRFAGEIVRESEGNVLLGCVLIWIDEMRRAHANNIGGFALSAITTTFSPMNYSRTQFSSAERLLLIAVCDNPEFWASEGTDEYREVTTYLATALHLPSTRDALLNRLTNESIYIRQS